MHVRAVASCAWPLAVPAPVHPDGALKASRARSVVRTIGLRRGHRRHMHRMLYMTLQLRVCIHAFWAASSKGHALHTTV